MCSSLRSNKIRAVGGGVRKKISPFVDDAAAFQRIYVQKRDDLVDDFIRQLLECGLLTFQAFWRQQMLQKTLHLGNF